MRGARWRRFVGVLARTKGVQKRARRIDGALHRANRRGFIAGLKAATRRRRR